VWNVSENTLSAVSIQISYVQVSRLNQIVGFVGVSNDNVLFMIIGGICALQHIRHLLLYKFYVESNKILLLGRSIGQ